MKTCNDVFVYSLNGEGVKEITLYSSYSFQLLIVREVWPDEQLRQPISSVNTQYTYGSKLYRVQTGRSPTFLTNFEV